MQRAASAAALAAVAGADPNTRLTPINWIGVAFGVMLLAADGAGGDLDLLGAGQVGAGQAGADGDRQAALTASGQRELKPRHRRRREAMHEHAVCPRRRGRP